MVAITFDVQILKNIELHFESLLGRVNNKQKRGPKKSLVV